MLQGQKGLEGELPVNEMVVPVLSTSEHQTKYSQSQSGQANENEGQISFDPTQNQAGGDQACQDSQATGAVQAKNAQQQGTTQEWKRAEQPVEL